MKIRHQLDQASQDAASIASGTVNDLPSRTLQGPAAEADINNIIRTYGSPAMFPVPPQVADPRYYGDMTDVPDLQTALERIRDAAARFERLPATLRAKFNNSPADLYDFVHDPRNAKEAVSLGLLKEKAPPAPPEPPTPPATTT